MKDAMRDADWSLLSLPLYAVAVVVMRVLDWVYARPFRQP